MGPLPKREGTQFQILVFGPFTPKLRSGGVGTVLPLKTAHVHVGPFSKDRNRTLFRGPNGPKPKIENVVSQGRVWYVYL